MGKSSFDAYQDYILWEQALNGLKEDVAAAGVQSAFQTSEYWKQVFMEIVGKGQSQLSNYNQVNIRNKFLWR